LDINKALILNFKVCADFEYQKKSSNRVGPTRQHTYLHTACRHRSDHGCRSLPSPAIFPTAISPHTCAMEKSSSTFASSRARLTLCSCFRSVPRYVAPLLSTTPSLTSHRRAPSKAAPASILVHHRCPRAVPSYE
jgi:hypothetical protein